MIKENQKYLNTFHLFIDLILILISFTLADYIRFDILEDGYRMFSLPESFFIISPCIPIFIILYAWFNLYTPQRTKSFYNEAINIFTVNVITNILIIVMLFLIKQVHFSRKTIVIFGIINVVLTIFYRGVLRLCLRRYRKLGYNQKHCLIIGSSSIAVHLIDKLKKHSEWGYNILGFLKNPDYTHEALSTYRCMGDFRDLDKVLDEYDVDVVMIALTETYTDKLGYILKQCEKNGVKTHIVPYYYQYLPTKPYIDDLDGLPIIDTRHVPLDNLFKNILKRLFDICFSIVALVITSPIILLSIIIIKLTSKGPVFFKQERIGLSKKPFNMYKLRSMHVQTDDEEAGQWTTQDDPRKTKWGNFMRRTSIDELPQFYNVLKGEMSVVGPRPERPYFVDKFKEEIPRYMVKHQVRPGITGWAQVNGLRGDTSIEDRISHDLYYIENWTFGMDVKIILMTITHGFIHKNAY